MMLDRDRIGFWTRFVAIGLAAIFVLTGIFFGFSGNVSYTPFDLFGGGDQPPEQTTNPDEQIDRARADLEENPDDPRTVRRLGGLLIQAGRTDEAIEVLEAGREAAPDDPYLPLLLGQAHSTRAQAQTEEEQRRSSYSAAGEAFAAAAEVQEGDNRKAQAYLLAGQAYDEAGEQGNAIQYWNEYLRLEPEGEEAEGVKERIQTLLEGGGTTGAAGE